MSFKAISLALVLALASTSSAEPSKNSTASVRAGFANSYQRYFVFNDEQLTFFEAWQRCRSLGLRLASVHSALDDVKLKVALAQKDINQLGPWWIAGTDLGKEGSFVWITGNRGVGERTGYTNFAEGQPDNYLGNEHCLEAGWRSGTLWNDASCDTKNRFICEMDTCDC